MSFGGWSIDEDVFEHMKRLVPPEGSILELGSGEATKNLVEHWKTVHSIEHNKEWLGKFHDNYIHAPLVKHKAIQNHEGDVWYDARVLEVELPLIEYDMILIDGPPGARGGFVKYLSLFNPDVPMLFDDANLKRNWLVMRSVSMRLRRPYTVYNAWGDTGKDYGII